jgi:hypothetical protein
MTQFFQLRHYATNQTVAGSSPNEVTCIDDNTRGNRITTSVLSYIILLEQHTNYWTRILLPFDEGKHMSY